ncbi:DUF6198 family protein [Lactobacillus sp. ESL0677]|uniref:YczE/YyaS/YitT family protein n=1 Tax=Lactobacillus sp. ESL0677 TaxID=2983208 RepID=UPI0023F62DA3|nr:DUF6198 family protein [Lactobacillus sp. ESL0677]WEV36901.1 DUF6198 family protein [Lactobacillus sp. ESL0677]
MENSLIKAFHPRNLLILFCGLSIMAIGVSLSKLAALGTSPIASIPNVVSYLLPVSIGNLTIIFMIILVLLEALFLRRDFSTLNLLQIIPGSCFGFLIDFFMKVFSFVKPHNYLEQISLTILSIVILAIGVFLEISSSSIILPGEGLARAMAWSLKKKFAVTKVIVDFSMVVIALAIALIYFHSLVGIREGTIISALCVGPLVKLFRSIKSKLS